MQWQALTRRSLFIVSFRSLSVTNSTSLSNIRIAHFSSYTSNNTQQSFSYPFRRHEDEARSVRVSVWWDFENIHLPATVSPYQVAQRITAALRANGIKGPVQISAYGNVSILTRPIQEALSSTGISLIHAPAGGKNGADRLLIIDLLHWVSQHPPPAHLFLISGDSDFAGILHRLRMSNYNILVANGQYVSTPLCSAASIMWQWNSLLKGENLAGKRFNQPPDGLAGSWYGNSRLPLENLFPSVEQSAALTGDGSSESESENVLRPIPSDVVNKVRQILGSHPKGVSITILRRELYNEMIIDDDLYGYRKFSRFLLAMPDVLKIHHLGPGQYSVSDVNSKTARSPSPDSSTNSSESSFVNDSKHSTPLIEVEVNDGSSSTKPEDKKPAPDPPILSSHKQPQSSQLHGSLDTQEMQHPSSATAIHAEEPSSPVTGGISPPNNNSDHLAVIKKPYDYKEDNYFKRAWKRLFGGNDDLAMKSQEDNTVKLTPTSRHPSSLDSSPIGKPIKSERNNGEGHDKSESCDVEGHKQRGFFSRIVGWFKFNGSVSEASTIEHKEHNIFSDENLWAEIKSFLGTVPGAEIVSKVKSRVHMAQTMKKDGPAVLHSFNESDLVHLVDLLIDGKKWVEQCPSQSSPFKLSCISGESITENPNKSNTLSSSFMGKQHDSDLQKLPKHEGEMRSQKPHGIYLPGDHRRSSEKTRTRMLYDCRRLLNEVVKEYPHGFPLKGFRKLFAERYCYNLNLEALGFETLASLAKKIPGLTVEGAFVYPNKKSDEPPSKSSAADMNFDSSRKSGHSVSDSEQSDISRNDRPSDSEFDELGPAMDSSRTIPSKAKFKWRTGHGSSLRA